MLIVKDNGETEIFDPPKDEGIALTLLKGAFLVVVFPPLLVGTLICRYAPEIITISLVLSLASRVDILEGVTKVQEN